MTSFSENLARLSATPSFEVEREKTVSEGNVGEERETGSESGSWGLRSVLSQRDIEMLIRGYGLGEEVETRLPRENETARTPRKGYVAIFESQLKLGLRFPVFRLLCEMIGYYGVSITLVFSLGIGRMVAFEMACSAVKVESSMTLFRHFYHLKRTGGFYYVCGRSMGKDFLAKNKDLASRWRR